MTRRAAAVLLLALVAACAPPKPPSLPGGSGTPFPDFASAYHEATTACAGIQTFTAVLGLTGRAGRTKLRGRLEAGFAVPASMRLTGVPPFGGRPVFVLTATAADSTLVLPRERRVLRDEPPAEIVDALAGVPLGAAELRAAVTGCGLWDAEGPSAGMAYSGDWATATVADGTAYLRRVEGAWRLLAAARGTVTVYYSDFAGGRPATVRIRAVTATDVTADITLSASQVEVNVPLKDAVFAADVPEDATPMTLDELREAGPLGQRDR